MKNSGERIITDKKVIYLVRTLSRTKRKDYENYVVNAIWNKLNDDSLEIVTQQYIHNPKDERKHYFIDLYFPALKIGIECDEAHHFEEVNIELDKEREASIYDALHETDNKGYIPIHINAAKTYQEVQGQIDGAVKTIEQEKAKINPPKWEIQDAREYYGKRGEITVSDKVGFTTINQVCNILFSADYEEQPGGARNSFFTPCTFVNTEYDGYKAWFPQLAVRDENGEPVAASTAGWKNQLINNGKELIEDKDNGKLLGSKNDFKKRIVFAKYKDPLGDNGYKFVGIFELEKDYKGGERHYHRIEDKCTILRK